MRAFVESRPTAVRSVLINANLPHPDWLTRALPAEKIRSAHQDELERCCGGVVHQGLVALGAPPRMLDLPEFLDRAPALVLALDGLTDPRNVGALLRSAEALGVGGVLMTNDRAPELTPGLVKAAAGAVEHLPLVRVVNLSRALVDAKRRGFWVVGLDAEGDVDLEDSARLPDPPLILVIGAEGRGLRPLVQRHCDRLVRISMVGRTESLNAAVAGAIAIHVLASRLRPPS